MSDAIDKLVSIDRGEMVKESKFEGDEENIFIKCPHIVADASWGFIECYGGIIWLQRTSPPFVRLILCPECVKIVRATILADLTMKIVIENAQVSHE